MKENNSTKEEKIIQVHATVSTSSIIDSTLAFGLAAGGCVVLGDASAVIVVVVVGDNVCIGPRTVWYGKLASFLASRRAFFSCMTCRNCSNLYLVLLFSISRELGTDGGAAAM